MSAYRLFKQQETYGPHASTSHIISQFAHKMPHKTVKILKHAHLDKLWQHALCRTKYVVLRLIYIYLQLKIKLI